MSDKTVEAGKCGLPTKEECRAVMNRAAELLRVPPPRHEDLIFGSMRIACHGHINDPGKVFTTIRVGSTYLVGWSSESALCPETAIKSARRQLVAHAVTLGAKLCDALGGNE